jgi:catechol 2,3-dioxygenase-like lactoylglutathione lyase family enzyme
VQLHHVTLFVDDADRAVRFYRDGLGLAVLVDREFDGPWPRLFDAPSMTLRSVIFGDPARPDAAQVEVVTYADDPPAGGAPAPTSHGRGAPMLAFFADLDAALPAVVAAGGTDVRRTTLDNGYGIATVRDPDGVLVELIGTRKEAGG